MAPTKHRLVCLFKSNSLFDSEFESDQPLWQKEILNKSSSYEKACVNHAFIELTTLIALVSFT